MVSFRALHMKEHPDYKYRPRRKPKTLVKSPTPSQQQSTSSKDTSPPPMNQSKYAFNSQFELAALSMPQRPPAFSLSPYVPMDAITSPMSTIALDLQARLHAMYYQSWRNAYNPFNQLPDSSPSPPPALLYGGCIKPGKAESPPTVQRASPTPNIIWPTPLRYSSASEPPSVWVISRVACKLFCSRSFKQ